MKRFFENLSEFIDDNYERIILTVIALIFFVLIGSIPLMIIGDFYTKNRALDIYEETGVMITIDSKDLIEMTK